MGTGTHSAERGISHRALALVALSSASARAPSPSDDAGGEAGAFDDGLSPDLIAASDGAEGDLASQFVRDVRTEYAPIARSPAPHGRRGGCCALGYDARPPMRETNETERAEIGLCLLLAAADGDVSEQEIGALSSRLGTLLGDDYPAIATGVIADGEIDRMAAMGPDRYVASLAQRIPIERRERALRAALAVALADGLAPEEERMFRDCAAALGLSSAEADRLLAETAP